MIVCACILYPLAGILADMYLTRLKAMFYGTYIQLIGTVLVLVITVAFIINESLASQWYILLVIVVAYAMIQLGLAIMNSFAYIATHVYKAFLMHFNSGPFSQIRS